MNCFPKKYVPIYLFFALPFTSSRVDLTKKLYVWSLQVRKKKLRQTFCCLIETHVILGGSNNRLQYICSRGAVIVFYHSVQAVQKVAQARTEEGVCREGMSTAGNQDLNSSKRYKWSTLLKSKTFRLRGR